MLKLHGHQTIILQCSVLASELLMYNSQTRCNFVTKIFEILKLKKLSNFQQIYKTFFKIRNLKKIKTFKKNQKDVGGRMTFRQWSFRQCSRLFVSGHFVSKQTFRQ